MGKIKERPVTLKELLPEVSSSRPDIQHPVVKWTRDTSYLIIYLLSENGLNNFHTPISRQEVLTLLVDEGITEDTTLDELATIAKKGLDKRRARTLDIVVGYIRESIFKKRVPEQ